MEEDNIGCLRRYRVKIVGLSILALGLVIAIGLIAGLLVGRSGPSKVSYKDVMVLEVKYRNTQEKEFAESLIDPARKIEGYSLNFLNVTSFEFPRSKLDFLKSKLEALKMDYYILHEDKQRLVDQVEKQIALRRLEHNSSSFDIANFHPYEEITKYLHGLAARNHMVDVHQVGLSYEKRDILMATVSTKESTKKPIIFFDCLIHSGEWITTSTCLWILDQLANGYGKDSDVTRLLDSFDWYVKPVSNPDGYVYSWNTDRFWRKNRAPNRGSSCVGVDVNRNFGTAFSESNTITSNAVDPCAKTFKGYAPFSELESVAIRDVLLKYKDRIKMALFIHSYGQLWMSPFGVNVTAPPHYDQMDRVMKKAAAAIEAVYGTKYLTGSIASVIYPASSSTVDYAYEALGIVHTYALELPDRGNFGFTAPVSKIVPVATETWSGIKEAVYTLLEELGNSSNIFL